MEAHHSSLSRQQAHSVYASFAGNVNYVGHVLEINIVVAAHKGYAFRSNLENIVQPVLQILPLHGLLIDREIRGLSLLSPDT